ncbi:hypothetical protein AB0C21_37480 [Spirillospora sp. NPDC049024]
MWPDLQVGLIGLIGVVLIGRGVWELRRSWPTQRGKKLAETLGRTALGLPFLGSVIGIVFFDVPFDAASGKQLVLSLAIWAGLIAWKVWTTRRDNKSAP